MPTFISPGVYTNIIDLSSYVQEVPSTTGLILAITPKGRDNQLTMVTSRSDLLSEWGEPDITRFGDMGKAAGQAHYFAYNFLGESGSLYFMRCLPDDAKFASLVIEGTLAPGDSSATISINYAPERETLTALEGALAPLNHVNPLCVIYPIGRGEYYNSLGIRLTAHSNPVINDVYILDIYETQSTGYDSIVESFEISFDPQAVDLSGDSIWIVDILQNYSHLLRCTMTQVDGDLSPGYTLLTKVFDKNIGAVSVTDAPVVFAGAASITDTKQNFHDWENPTEAGDATFMVIAKDAFGTEIFGWLGAADLAGTEVNVFNGRDLSTSARLWSGDVANFRPNTTVEYRVKESNTLISDAFIGSNPIPIMGGSEGSIKDSLGNYDSSATIETLSRGYNGILTNPITAADEETILDTENFGFNVIFDGGFPQDVKTQIINLAQTRADCIAFLDNGDNYSVSSALIARSQNAYNTLYAALYESYNKVYDSFTGKDIWFSPMYHLSYLVPRNDRVGEVWFAVAGYDTGSIGNIKALRFSPRQSERDQMYLAQINPIVKFSDGYVLFGQQTTQTKPSSLQDVNVVRLVLYIEKALKGFCRTFVFKQNDAITWSSIKGQVDGFLANVQARRGLYGYTIDVGATDYELKRKQCHVNVILQPVKSLEIITLNLYIE